MQKTAKGTALLLDATYFEKNGKSVIALYCADENKHFWLTDSTFHPYFYVTAAESEAEKAIKEIEGITFGESEPFKVMRATKTNAKLNQKSVIKLEFGKVQQVISARKTLSEMGYERHEHDITFAKRYLLDTGLEPANWIEYEAAAHEETTAGESPLQEKKQSNAHAGIQNQEGEDEEQSEGNSAIYGKAMEIKKIKVIEKEFFGNAVAFDLETKVGKKFAIGIEPILMASVVANSITAEKKEKQNHERVMTYGTKKIPKLEMLEDEKELIQELTKELDGKNTSYIITYNGDNFDFSYLKERAKKFKLPFEINGSQPAVRRKGLDNAVKLLGVQHIDSYQIIKFLARTGAVNVTKLDIESVSEKVFGEYKEKVYPMEITQAWESGDEKKLARLVDYNLKDSRVAFRIAKEFLPLFVEISKLTSQTLYETTRSSTSQMVEDLLLKEAHLRGIIAPNKPKEGEVAARTANPIKGAFVKEPTAGLHEGIAVLDFASLYPSIIISHNISPETLNCGHEECRKNISPDNTYFCTKKKGLFPEILEKMLRQRLVLKREYSRKKKEEGIDDRVLFAKQWALKIILNSVYGYLGYPRARWYSRECASATTAWERAYINQTIAKAEQSGFKVLYSDTDSAFLLMGQKPKEEVKNFVEKINKEIPEEMELELEGFYKRGIFVTKKEGGAAKKRYALMDEKGNLKIVGFEYVRRDWCMLARETQRKVLELVLSQGKPEKAIEEVKRVIKELKEGKTPKKDLVIMTVLQRETKDYSAIGPHVAAAQKAIARGKELGSGSMLSFIVTKNSKSDARNSKGKESISEKAELEEYVKEGDYDADYYIENQLLPAVMKIIQEFGHTKEDLLTGGKQTGLSAWG